jgi:hypothetical protein
MERNAFILCCLLIMAGTTYAQLQNCNIIWGDVIMLCDSADVSYLPIISLSGDDTIHVTWNNDYGYRLPYRRSTDGGNTFEPMKEMLSDSVTYWLHASWPYIVSDHNDVYIFFTNGDAPLGDTPVRMIKSHDGGTKWDGIREITSELSGSIHFAAISGDTIFIQYPHLPQYASKVIFSKNGGQTWDNFLDSIDYYTLFDLTPSTLHMLRNAGPTISDAAEVLYSNSMDLGRTWLDSVLLSTNDRWYSDVHALAVSENNGVNEIWSVWRDTKYGWSGNLGASIINRWGLDGKTWQPEQLLTDQQNETAPS